MLFMTSSNKHGCRMPFHFILFHSVESRTRMNRRYNLESLTGGTSRLPCVYLLRMTGTVLPKPKYTLISSFHCSVFFVLSLAVLVNKTNDKTIFKNNVTWFPVHVSSSCKEDEGFSLMFIRQHKLTTGPISVRARCARKVQRFVAKRLSFHLFASLQCKQNLQMQTICSSAFGYWQTWTNEFFMFFNSCGKKWYMEATKFLYKYQWDFYIANYLISRDPL